MAYKNGKPSNEVLMLLAKNILRLWRKLGRALRVDDNDLDEIEIDEKGVYEQSYKMLKTWTEQQGSRASFMELAKALIHSTVNRGDLVLKFCINHEVENATFNESIVALGDLSLDNDDVIPQSIPPISILLGEPFHKTFARDKELNVIEDLFYNLDPDGSYNDVTTVYLTGPPGAGKSQLSRLYGKSFSQRRCPNQACSIVVATLHAETPESLLESYKRLACALKIEVSDADKYDDVWQKLNSYTRATKRVFRSAELYNFEWLMIIDNVVASEPLKEFWPLPGYGWGRGRVLVTTQDTELAPTAHVHAKGLSLAKGMEEEDAIDLLCLISELDKDDCAVKVAQRLNYYPLSLACAAVFVRDMRHDRPAAKFSWKDYMSNLNKYFELLKYSEFTDHNLCYPKSMLSAAFCSASRIAESSSLLCSAFKFLSQCALQPLPLELVADAIISANKDGTLIPDEVKKKIAKCSLLIYPQDGVRGIEVITMHQVMRAAFIQLRKEACKIAMETRSPEATIDLLDRNNFEATLMVMCEYYRRHQSIGDHAISTRILLSPHLQACIDKMNAAERMSEVFIDGSVCLADSLIHVAGATDYHRVQILELAYKSQKTLELNNLCACRLLGNLGYTYREANQLDKAFLVLDEAVRIADHQQGAEWIRQKSHILNHLSFTYRERYQLDLAKAYMQMCVDITKQAYGNQHPEVIERLCNYGIILHDRGENEESIEVLEEARRMRETLGLDSRNAVNAQVVNYTAKVYLRWFLALLYTEGMTERSKTFLEKSKLLHEEALLIYEHLHGKDQKFYSGTEMTYSTVLRHMGQLDLALAHIKHAVKVYRSSGHIAWPRTITLLADIYIARGQFSLARDCIEESLKTQVELGMSLSTPGGIHAQALLAEVLVKTGHREDGERKLEKCIEDWREKGLRPEHYWVLRVRNYLENIDNEAKNLSQ